MAVAGAQGGLDGVLDLVGAGLPGAEADEGDFGTGVEGGCFPEVRGVSRVFASWGFGAIAVRRRGASYFVHSVMIVCMCVCL